MEKYTLFVQNIRVMFSELRILLLVYYFSGLRRAIRSNGTLATIDTFYR